MPCAEGSSREQEPARRLFFALWPQEADQRELERATRDAVRALLSSPGSSQRTKTGLGLPRSVPACNFHVTLVFLGSIPEARLASVRSIAEAVSHEVCEERDPGECVTAGTSRLLELVFERIEYWKRAKVLCALPSDVATGALGSESGASAGRATAAALAGRLRERLLADGFAPDLKPFRVHVTLARKVNKALGHAMRPVTWRFPQFALIDSRTGSAGSLYSALDRWPLCAESAQMSGKKAQ
ncbi:MAG TPA: hypothetical protein VGL55_04085 [Steroidobacteraceae bacterium]|jgi:2'-5' RNA ligase